MGWANAWHGLGALPFPRAVQRRAAGDHRTLRRPRGAARGGPNGSALNAVRTNEIDFGFNGIWQLREFALSPATGSWCRRRSS